MYQNKPTIPITRKSFYQNKHVYQIQNCLLPSLRIYAIPILYKSRESRG